MVSAQYNFVSHAFRSSNLILAQHKTKRISKIAIYVNANSQTKMKRNINQNFVNIRSYDDTFVKFFKTQSYVTNSFTTDLATKSKFRPFFYPTNKKYEYRLLFAAVYISSYFNSIF